METVLRQRTRHAVCLIAALWLTEAAYAQQGDSFRLPADVTLAELVSRNFGMSDGLPSNWINDVALSRDGYVWIATDNGLVRYGGDGFRLITAASTQQSPRSDIRVLFEGRDQALWIGTSGGLACRVPGHPARLQWIEKFLGTPVFAIHQDGDDNVWVGTAQQTFVGTRQTGFRAVDNAPKNVRAFCQTRDGVQWIGSHAGLFRATGEQYEQLTHERLPAFTPPGSGIPQTRVNTILQADDGSIWVGTNRALLHYQDGQFTSRGLEIEAQQIYQVTQTRDGSLYAAARFGLFRSDGESAFVKVSETPSVFCVTEDIHGGLWVGHGDNRGLKNYRDLHTQEIWSGARVRCLFQAGGSDRWFGSNRGLHRMGDGGIETISMADGLPDARVQSISRGSEDTLLIATGGGLARWSGSQLISSTFPDEVSSMNIGVALEDSKKAIWIGLASGGGYVLRDGQLTELSALSPRRIHWFWEDPSGVIWIGHEEGLFHYRDGQLQQQRVKAMETLNHPRVLCHDQETPDVLWIGTSNGILRYRSGRYEAFPPDCGLGADNIERLAADGKGNLWFGGRDGLFYVKIAELNAYQAGSLSRVASYRIPGFDRFPPVHAFSQGCMVRDDQLWLVGELGLTRTPIQRFQGELPPPVIHIESVVHDGKGMSFAAPFEMQSGPHRLLIAFDVLALENHDHIEVAYRLVGHDPDWVSADGQGTAQYTDLRPGDYRFHVRARRGNAPWVEAGHHASFRVVPRLWERTWLRALIVIAAMIVIAGYVRHRLETARRINDELRREIHERELAEEQSRRNQEQLARISRAASMGELSTSIAHEIKQPLFAIVANAQTARKLLDKEQPDVDEVREALSDITCDGNRASEIIDRIRALLRKQRRPTQDVNVNDVVREATAFAEAEMRRRHVQLNLDLTDELPTIAGDPIELQQVILNLLINGAQATGAAQEGQMAIRTCVVDRSVQVAVEDQGIGIDADKMQQIFEPFFTTKPEGTGMGLAINRTIVEAHGGRIWAEHNEHGGMTFLFHLPAGDGGDLAQLTGQSSTETARGNG